MKKMIVTNNKKVESTFQAKEDVMMLNNASAAAVLKEGLKVAEKGGKLLLDPNRRKNFYKSLVFLMDEQSGPDEKSLALIKKCMDDKEISSDSKEPILAGIHQNRDLDLIRSILS